MSGGTWRVWAEDAMAARLNVLGTSYEVTSNDDFGAYMFDMRGETRWYAGGTTLHTISMDTVNSSDVGAIGLGGHSLSGVTIAYGYEATLGGSKTQLGTFVPSDNSDIVLRITPDQHRYWYISFTPSIGDYIATLSLLQESGLLEMAGGRAEFPIGYTGINRKSWLQPGGGSPVPQIRGGVGASMPLTFTYVPAGDGQLVQDIRDLHESTGGFASPVWITDDSFDDSTNNPARGYYGIIRDFDSPIDRVGPRASVFVDFEKFPRKV